MLISMSPVSVPQDDHPVNSAISIPRPVFSLSIKDSNWCRRNLTEIIKKAPLSGKSQKASWFFDNFILTLFDLKNDFSKRLPPNPPSLNK